MLNEGLKNIDNASVIIGIVEEEQPESPDVLLRVSEEGFSTSARGLLYEYCKVKFGFSAMEDFREKYADDPRFAWAAEYSRIKKKWAFAPDDAARRLIGAICDGSEADIKAAVDAGGCIMTNDMLLATIPFSNLSDEILRYLFVHAMSLPIRCMGVLTLCQETQANRDSGLYSIFCNMVTILTDVLIKNEGV